MLWISDRNKSEYTEYIKTDKRTFAVACKSFLGGICMGILWTVRIWAKIFSCAENLCKQWPDF